MRSLGGFWAASLVVGSIGAPQVRAFEPTFPNICYDSVCDRPEAAHMLDVWLPPGDPAGLPTIICVHGGAWRSGDKRDHDGINYELSRDGFGVVCCNYTLSTPETGAFPQNITDIKNVIRWVREVGVGEPYGLSPRVVLLGASAGAHLSVLAATSEGESAFEIVPATWAGGYSVQSAVSFFGALDLEFHMLPNVNSEKVAVEQMVGVRYPSDLFRQASPLTYLAAGDPPVALRHGNRDNTVPFEESLRFRDGMLLVDVFTPTDANGEIIETGAGHGWGDFGNAAQLRDEITGYIADMMPPGDVTGDQEVDLSDVGVVLGHWGECAASQGVAYPITADLDDDGCIGLGDIGIVLAYIADR